MEKKIIDINEHTIKKFVESIRPTPEIRDEVDIVYTYKNKTVQLLEVRPDWQDSKKKITIPFARSRYYKSINKWKLFWQRENGDWELYEPNPIFTHLSEVLEVVDKDEYGCFKG